MCTVDGVVGHSESFPLLQAVMNVVSILTCVYRPKNLDESFSNASHTTVMRIL